MQKRFLIFSGFSGAIGVAFGAMGAHYLKSKLETGLISEKIFVAFESAVKYQLFHTLALLILAAFNENLNSKLIPKVGYCFMAGIVLFSGSLYLITAVNLLDLPAMRWLGPITPIGGLFLIVGWLLLAFAGMKKREGFN